jgi:iron-sulfur cluster assembly protein
MFNMTPAAVREILAAAARSNAAGMALRVAARQVADGSIEFGMGFDEEREDDESARFEALTVLIGAPSKPLLEDAILDYAEVEAGRFDFVFLAATEPEIADRAAVASSPGGGCGHGGCSHCGG